LEERRFLWRENTFPDRMAKATRGRLGCVRRREKRGLEGSVRERAPYLKV
jgi:hypothetical protein